VRDTPTAFFIAVGGNMQIVLKPTSELIPYAKNAKVHDARQIENVANSIRRFGWQQPIVIDDNNVVVIGHCRLLAAKKLGQKEVPVTVASGLTEDEIKELRIADNKTNESTWDFELLKEDSEGLEFEGFDFEWDGLGEEYEEKEVAEDDFDPDEDLPEEPTARHGDIYQLGRHRLMCGDSTDISDVYALMGGV
jgi:site-specific DNA-methyltransferase (adenine-specific)